ncbi:MAG: hypothetical protein US63_C0036G0006 [Candidatus Moranbacteria bacterium GW2011_GWC2_37_8]|nr:MAG: hypothetical protein US63_C0036G0006 [Candidatus Moranbacteria bacterium GW2011_GWC2_37_8]KKQ60624.1 MAG: hypothetical protein US82_C0031G0005 [Parcubacteria group bacterium GW2011_GWC1_38_22]KKQ80624.1 MAG: hypothetical protein UT03_C0021G0007 [Candidatus Moranbacteria bacterium GW2011_GWD2_38_7]
MASLPFLLSLIHVICPIFTLLLTPDRIAINRQNVNILAYFKFQGNPFFSQEIMHRLYPCLPAGFHISFSAKETWRKENSHLMKILWQRFRSSLKFLLRLFVVSQKFLHSSLIFCLRTSYGADRMRNTDKIKSRFARCYPTKRLITQPYQAHQERVS